MRPFGCWGPVRAEAVQRGLVPARDPMPRIDLLNGLVTAMFQLALALVPFYLFLRRWPQMGAWLAVLVDVGRRALFHLVPEPARGGRDLNPVLPMTKPVLHLICNAHLDPVWQWRWEEGCAEALSTFATAVELLHEHPALVFNHNEAVLYRWVKEHASDLFREIQQLASAGRWCISGGWYLQPDVNLPDTESLIRGMAEGRRFFREHFGVEPRVAYNFDSFGHSAWPAPTAADAQGTSSTST